MHVALESTFPYIGAFSSSSPLRSCCERELAYQIAHQFRAFGATMQLRDAVIIGGEGASGFTYTLYSCGAT